MPLYEEKEMVAMQDIIGRVSFFALNRILRELNRAWDNCRKYDINSDNCWCSTPKNYGLPCQHYIAKNGFYVKLSDIPSRWHLDYDIGMVLYILAFQNLLEL